MVRKKPSEHRKVWKSHHGKIPYDEFGYRYEIHHIDGDPNNNAIDNLIALTIFEHYEIHYWQSDWGACQNIVIRMNITPEERSSMARELSIKRVEDGLCIFTDPDFIITDSIRKSKIMIGTGNPMYGKTHTIATRSKMKNSHNEMVNNGTHHTLSKEWSEAAATLQTEFIKNGIHNFQNPINKLAMKAANNKMMKNGTHPLQNGNRVDPNSIKVSCIVCHHTTTLPCLWRHRSCK